MDPWILLLLPALFFSLLLLLVPFHCIVDPTSTTLAISQMTSTVCGIMAGSQNHSIQCTQFQESDEFMTSFPINSTFSFDSISGGHNFICSLRSGDTSFFCWDGNRQRIKCVYSGPTVPSGISVRARHVAAIDGNRTMIQWWRYGCNSHARRCRNFSKSVYGEYHSLTSGDGFTCAISGAHSVQCWGTRAKLIQRRFAGVQMRSLTAGADRMCGLNMTGHLICTGNQLNVPSGEAFEFTSVAIGENHTCAIRRNNGTAVCWGRYGSYFPMGSTGFEFLVAGGNLTCGLTTYAFTVACWGLNGRNLSAVTLSLPKILPGVCVPDEIFCSCGVYPESGDLCGDSGVICKRSDTDTMESCPFSAIIEMAPHATSQTIWDVLRKWWFVYGIFGIVLFTIVGLGISVFKQWLKLPWCRVQESSTASEDESYREIASGPNNSPNSPSGDSGPTVPVIQNVQVFSFIELKIATQNFSMFAQIGSGAFSTVYSGQLSDGRQVAVKRCKTNGAEYEAAFKAELETQTTARHVNVVSLIGYCTENNERICVFEFMPNGDLYKHIHPKYSIWRQNNPLLSPWKLRVKILLDAARGIEYLHRHADPRIIHRDIKLLNILLDENWVAKISDFGLAVFGPKPGFNHVDVDLATGTLGYLDPDCNPVNACVTQRSDVYSFGVVMLEVFTGFRAHAARSYRRLATFLYPVIASGQLVEMLDKRLAVPVGHEMEAMERVAQLAGQCVSRSALERPDMEAVVIGLQGAFELFEQEVITN